MSTQPLKLYSLFSPKSVAVLKTKKAKGRTPHPSLPPFKREGESLTHTSKNWLFGLAV
jgi:hypothetical protein